MVFVVEIMVGIIRFLVGLFTILDAYKEYYQKENVSDFWLFIEYLFGFVLIIIGFIVVTLGVDEFYNLIYHILSIEVYKWYS